MNLRRYDTYIVNYDDDAFIEEYENINGEHTNANDALNIITTQKIRIAELEEKVKSMRNCLNCKHVSNEYGGYQCVNQRDYECEVEGKYDQFWEAKMSGKSWLCSKCFMPNGEHRICCPNREGYEKWRRELNEKFEAVIKSGEFFKKKMQEKK